jgi:hypothetical protein
MHSSLMQRTGARPEIVRDNMGHSDVYITLDVYRKSWWEEPADAVLRIAELLRSSQTDDSLFQSNIREQLLLDGLRSTDPTPMRQTEAIA